MGRGRSDKTKRHRRPAAQGSDAPDDDGQPTEKNGLRRKKNERLMEEMPHARLLLIKSTNQQDTML